MQPDTNAGAAKPTETLLASIRAEEVSGVRVFVRILAVAGTYFVMGRLGLMLSLDNGYSTLIWPPSGVALIALFFFGLRAWPGLLLGAFLVNTSFTGSPGEIFTSMFGAYHNYFIALGNSGQGVLAYMFLLRLLGDNPVITRPRDIIMFFFVAGPVACLTAASVGATSLYSFGIIGAEDFGTVWLTWWLGDTNGALLAAPLIVITAMPSELGSGIRRMIVSFGLLLVLVLLALIVYMLQARNDDSIRQRLVAFRTAVSFNIETGLNELAHDLAMAGTTIKLKPGITRSEYQSVAATTLTAQPELISMSWNRVVPHSERPAAEAALLDNYGVRHGLKWRNSEGVLEPAPRADSYTYVHYIVPIEDNLPALGYAISTNVSRQISLAKARDMDVAVLTPRLNLVQEQGSSYGALMFVPVKIDGEVLGYSTGVIRMDPLLKSAMDLAGASDIHYRLLDATGNAGNQLLASSYPEGEQLPRTLDMFTTRQTIKALDREWVLYLTPSEMLMKSFEDAGLSQLVFVLAVLTTAVLSIFMLVMLGAQLDTQRLVKQRTAELEHANAAKTTFLNNVSHEIRTPMNGVVGMLALLSKTPLNDEQKDLIDLSRGSADTLLKVINDVLDVSLMERGEFKIENRPADVVAAVSECVKLLSPTADQHSICLSSEMETSFQGKVNIDIERLKQVLYNLIGNAIKFTLDGGHVWVRTAIDVDGAGNAHVEIMVEDSGIGMSEADQQKVFERFAQVDSSATRRTQGAGLGLPISAKIVELMGGTLSLESREGVGTRAKVVFDQLEIVAAPPMAVEPGEMVVEASKPCALFVFEDNIVNKMLLEKVFAKRTETLEVASDGEKGVEMLRAKHKAGAALPDLILMDIQMPKMNGMEATKLLLAEDSPFKDIPILALTADALPEQQQEFLKAGMVDIVHKPIDFNELFAKIAHYR